MYKAQFEQNNIDIAMKNRELIDKIQQVDALKMKYEDAIANVEPIKTSSKVKRFVVIYFVKTIIRLSQK